MSTNQTEIVPGVELDRLIWEKVFGWKWPADSRTLSHAGTEHHLPFFSLDMSAAWNIVDRLTRMGYEFAIIRDVERDREGGAYAAEFDTGNGNIGETTYINGSRAAIAPLAICMAALKVVM